MTCPLISTAIILLAAFCVHAQNDARNRSSQGKIDLESCRLQGWDEDVRCGKFDVFEDRTANAGRKISLRIAVVPATGNSKAADPIFYFSGGPGGSAVETITRAGKTYLADLRRDRDLVFVDQRGTGGSNPLACQLFGDKNDMAAYFLDVMPIDRLQKCRIELEKIANLKLYSTPIAMADLDDVRAAMGYDKINLYGGSYGSTAALAYLRLYSEHVRSVTVLGVAPPAVRVPLPIAKGVQSALEKVFADCAEDAKCHSAFPDPINDLQTAAKRLEKGPVSVETANPYTNQPQKITLSRPVFGEFVRTMLYQTETSRWLPMLLHEAAEGDFSLFASVSFESFRSIEDQISRGMHFSVVCGEGMPFITDDEAARESAGTFYSNYRFQRYRDACKVWTRSDVAADFAEPVRSNVPVLMISGDADPVTPPPLAAAAVTHLPNGKQIVVPHSGHSVSLQCVNGLVASFVSSGTVKGLDGSCLSQVPRPVFITEGMIKVVHPASSNKTEQVWQGVLSIGQQKLRLVLHIFKKKDGNFAAYVVSPDQSASEIPVDVISIKDGGIHFELTLLGAGYDGKFNADNTETVGEWKQSGQKWPLNFVLQK